MVCHPGAIHITIYVSQKKKRPVWLGENHHPTLVRLNSGWTLFTGSKRLEKKSMLHTSNSKRCLSSKRCLGIDAIDPKRAPGHSKASNLEGSKGFKGHLKDVLTGLETRSKWT